MILALTVLNVVAPVFLLASLGFGWVRMGWEYPVAFVTRFAMTLAVPALIFSALMQTEISGATLGRFAIATCAAYGLVTAAAYLWVKLAGWEPRTYLAPLIMGNTGNIGLPLALFAFGDIGLGYAVIVLAITSVYAFTFGIWIVSGTSTPASLLREPMVIATLLGGLFLTMGWHTPEVLTRAITLLGQMAIPLMLVTLGVAVGRLTAVNFHRAVWICLVKALMCAAIGWGVALGFGLAPVPTGVLTVQMATPVAVTSYLIAEKYGADSNAVASLVVVSTAMSVGVLSLLLAFFL